MGNQLAKFELFNAKAQFSAQFVHARRESCHLLALKWDLRSFLAASQIAQRKVAARTFLSNAGDLADGLAVCACHQSLCHEDLTEYCVAKPQVHVEMILLAAPVSGCQPEVTASQAAQEPSRRMPMSCFAMPLACTCTHETLYLISRPHEHTQKRWWEERRRQSDSLPLLMSPVRCNSLRRRPHSPSR